MTTYNPNYPQYMVDVDVAKCKQSGISPRVVLATLQGYYGGMYASNFNSFGKLYRVMIQGDVASRMKPSDITNIYVRTAQGMVPVSEYCTLKRVYGPSNVRRFNLFTSINVNATPAEGYSSGEVIKAIEEVAAQTLPTGSRALPVQSTNKATPRPSFSPSACCSFTSSSRHNTRVICFPSR